MITFPAIAGWQYDSAMTVHDGVTGVAPTAGVACGPRAYTLDTVDEPAPYAPDVRDGFVRRWGVPVGALLIGVAALVGAVGFGVSMWRGSAPAPTPAPAPVAEPAPVEFRSPALLKPDQDTAFLMELDKGPVLYDTAGTAIHNAKLTCAFVNDGRDQRELAAELAKLTEAGTTPDEAMRFVTLAIKHYCPRD